MAGIGNIILLVGVVVGGYLLWTHKDELAGMLKLGGSAPPVVDTPSPTVTPSPTGDIASIPPSKTKTSGGIDGPVTLGPTDTASAGKDVPTADKNKGPFNYGPVSEGPDKGFGFSKDGGPVEANGYTADHNEPRVGDNRNSKNMTIASLPGPCETTLYKGLVQYRHNGLSASADSCTHAKQYYLYKYGVGANTNPPTGAAPAAGGGKAAKAPTYKAPAKAKKPKKAKFAAIEQYNAFFTYDRVSI